MNNPNQVPGTPPAPAGQTPGQPPAGGGAPDVDQNNQPSGATTPPQSGEQTPPSAEELAKLRQKAGRWDSLQKRDRNSRRNSRRQVRQNPDLDHLPADAQSAITDRDSTIQERDTEITGLKTKNRVRDLFDQNDDYKTIPAGVRRAIVKNPLGFASAESKTVDDVVEDIQDYLDDELDNMASSPAQPQNQGGDVPAGNPPANPSNPPANPPAPDPSQIPPASGSGPSTPPSTPPANTEGLTGIKKAAAVLQHSLKYKKHG